MNICIYCGFVGTNEAMVEHAGEDCRKHLKCPECGEPVGKLGLCSDCENEIEYDLFEDQDRAHDAFERACEDNILKLVPRCQNKENKHDQS